MTQEHPQPAQEGKDKDGKLISPPLSPEGKLGLKRALDDALSKSEGWMPIKALSTNRSHIHSFLSSYNHAKLKPRTVKKPKSKSSSLKQSKEYQVDVETTVNETNKLELGSANSGNSQSGYKSSSSDISGREYGTRSKKKKTQASDEDDESLPEAGSAGEPNSGEKSGSSVPSYDASELPDIIESSGWPLPMDDKVEWLNMSSVQLIHDSEFDKIPNCEPVKEWDDDKFSKVMKKLGLINGTKNVTLDRELKSLSSQEIGILNGLKLTSQQFIDTKKRFFAEKARKASHSLGFKKTDAQKACKIDVNKASKLYEIYQACGFLEDELYFK